MLKRLDNHIFKDHKGVISDQPHIHVLESLPKPRLVAWMLEKGHPFLLTPKNYPLHFSVYRSKVGTDKKGGGTDITHHTDKN